MALIVYRPNFQSQNPAVSHYLYGWQSCTAYSAAMAIDRATIGGTMVTGGYIRSISNEPIPDPHDPGLTLNQVIDAAAQLHVVLVNKTGQTFDDMVASLHTYRGVILQGLYSYFGIYSSQSSFKGGHAVYVNNTDGAGKNALVYDPLSTKERWIPLSILRNFSESLGGLSSKGIWYATTRITPLIDDKSIVG